MFFYASIFFWVQLLFLVVVQTLIYKKLGRAFDSDFKEDLWFEEFAAPWFPQIARAGQYALWVANKRIFGVNMPKVQAYDFKSKVDKNTYRLCVVHAINFSLLCGVWLPVGLVLMIQDWVR